MEPQHSSGSPPIAEQQSDPRVPLLGSYGSQLYAEQGVSREATIQTKRSSLTEHPAGSPTHGPTVTSLPLPLKNSSCDVKTLRTYPWRWVVLAIFFLNLGWNNMVWISVASVADVMRCYYGISNTWVNTTTTVYMATYIVFFLPCAWFLDRYGLKATMVLASFTTALGTAVRVAGTGMCVCVCVLEVILL